jgi:hypothetical protein
MFPVDMLEEELSPLVDEETYPFDEQLAGNGILPVHEIADQDEQDDEYVEQQGRLQEEMMAQYQEGLNPVSASDRLDESRGALITSHGEGSGALTTREYRRVPSLNNVVNGGDVGCPTSVFVLYSSDTVQRRSQKPYRYRLAPNPCRFPFRIIQDSQHREVLPANGNAQEHNHENIAIRSPN